MVAAWQPGLLWLRGKPGRRQVPQLCQLRWHLPHPYCLQVKGKHTNDISYSNLNVLLQWLSRIYVSNILSLVTSKCIFHFFYNFLLQRPYKGHHWVGGQRFGYGHRKVGSLAGHLVCWSVSLFVSLLLDCCLGQGLRSWGQFRKKQVFSWKKAKTIIFMCFRSFPVLSDAQLS